MQRGHYLSNVYNNLPINVVLSVEALHSRDSDTVLSIRLLSSTIELRGSDEVINNRAFYSTFIDANCTFQAFRLTPPFQNFCPKSKATLAISTMNSWTSATGKRPFRFVALLRDMLQLPENITESV
ncbi:conserved hypothetical protein [Trichinella spiralis]|uniref:hypothetical protein n=1 Tax=Trichinella spiralis TaxID=6334 RepID=UPI0001EFEAD6|nr:conserved hypothetical protein [Trichinella spiralis]